MPLLTTTIGAYPKPDYVPIPDWFGAEDGPDTTRPTAGYRDTSAENIIKYWYKVSAVEGGLESELSNRDWAGALPGWLNFLLNSLMR